MTSAGRTVAGRSARLALVASMVLSPLLLAPPSVAFADSGVCAVPGKDGPGGTLSGIVNTYYPGAGSAAAGATSIPIGAPFGAPTPIAAGDLLLVIQMQDAALDSSNTDAYGDGVAGSPASGWTDLRNAGRYEYVVALGPLVAGAVPILGAGAGAGLVYTYTSAAAAGADGQRRYQVIRVPQYSSATLSSGLTALRWDGNVGGVLALDVAGQLTLGGTVDLSGFGFRGGGGRQRGGSPGFLNTDYRTLTASNPNGSKGEGLAGTPRLIYNATTNSVVDTGIEGYPNGSMARGAPGNAGGGGTDGNTTTNDQNSGGGGGGNGGQGGLGGNTWSSNLPRGGQPGAAVPAAPARLTLGGGGGAGTRNNTPGNPVASSGGAGGGMVMMRAGAISGSGTIAVNGASGITPDNDGGGGGGGGGSVLVLSQGGGVGNLTLNARGGNGANAWPTQAPGGFPGNRHGPGGGGGGGVVLLSGAAASIDVSGGIRGTTTTAAEPYNATSGATGVARTNVTPAEVTTGISGAACLPELTAVKTTSTPGPMTVPNPATYTITVTNPAGTGAAIGASISDVLPSGFTYASNLNPVYAGGASGPATLGNSGTPGIPVFGVPGGDATNSFTIPGGGSVSITFTVNIGAGVPLGTYQNPARVDFTDPTRTAPGQTVTPGAPYASGGGTAGGSNYDPASSTGEDVTIVGPPLISKSFAPDTIAVGAISQLTLTLGNPNAIAATLSAAFVDTLPANVIVATPNGLSDTCPGLPSAPAGGSTITYPSGATIPAGGCTILLDVTSSTVGTHTNSIAAGDLQTDFGNNPAPASDDLTVTAPTVTDPAVTKSGDPATAAIGDSVVFTLVVTNTGPADADDVVVTDIVPSFLTINSVTVTNPLPPGSVNITGNTITLDFGTVTPTATCPPPSGTSCYLVTIQTTVNRSATPPGGSNTASLTLDPAATDADPDNNADSALTTIVIREPSAAPETGFAPGRTTLLPAQPAGAAYSELGDLWLEIPSLGIRRTITGVPRQAEGWEVTWLDDLAGYLEGTAFPTWKGNSVITGHVVLPSGVPGPFAHLDRLAFGDSLIVHAWGERYRYEVRSVARLKPTDPSIFRLEQRAWLTLVTCKDYDPRSGTYRSREVVRAVLIEIDGEAAEAGAAPASDRGR